MLCPFSYNIFISTPQYGLILYSYLFHRYNLPVIIIVVNNNGIYSGVDPETWKEMSQMGDLTSMSVTLETDAAHSVP